MAISALLVIIVVTALISLKGFNDPQFKYKLMYIPSRVHHERELYRTFTHLFIHADMTHLIFNMLSLYFLGEALQIAFILEYGSIAGQIYFVALYFLGGLFATLIPFIRHKDNSSYLSLGASGAVSAVIFATILWLPGMDLFLLFIPIPIPAWLFGLLYLAFEFWADKRGQGNIAHDAHIGGALFGIFFILVLNFEKGRNFIEQIF